MKISQIIQQAVNRLEENYRFNLNDFSFIYKGKKAFIVDVREKQSMIRPFSMYRKELIEYCRINELDTSYAFQSPDQISNFLHMSMGIIANMLDDTRMGSVENYLNHIWQEFDIAINNDGSSEPLTIFLGHIASIIQMIDFSIEIQLSNLVDPEKEISIIASAIEGIDPDLKVAGIFEIDKTGIKKLEIIKKEKKADDSDSIDLSKMKAINIKAI